MLKPALWSIPVLVAVVVAGCGTSSSVSSVAPTPDTAKCQMTMTTPPAMDASGGASKFSITTQPECAWTASSSVSWISAVSPGSGQGTGDVSFRVAANDGTSARDGDIVVNDNNRVHISQRAACRYSVSPASQSIENGGGSGTVSVATSSDCSWTATTDVDWITLVAPVSGNGNGSVRFTVPRGPAGPRSGSVIIGGQRSAIDQVAASANPTCTYSISPTSQSAAAAGGTGTATVATQTGCQWSASSGASWITITSGANGTGNGSVGFTIAANTGTSRTGSLTIAGRSFTVTQAAAGAPPPPPAPSCTYSISPSSRDVSAAGGTGNVSVKADNGCAWTAASNASWITVTSGANGSGDGSTGYLVAPNVAGARTGTLTVAGQTFTISQAALLCSYSVSPSNVKIGKNGGNGSVKVSASSGCSWTASSGESWITITSGASGSGNGSVTFTVAKNDGKKRTGDLTIAGESVTVEQDGQ